MRIKRYIIKPPQATGRRWPLGSLITLWLVMDRFKAPEWLWGIFYFLALLLIVLWIWDCATFDEISVDIQKGLKNQYEEEMKEELKEVFKNKAEKRTGSG